VTFDITQPTRQAALDALGRQTQERYNHGLAVSITCPKCGAPKHENCFALDRRGAPFRSGYARAPGVD
jgi:hypothetical protein